jgi:hypothetical protein
MSDIPECVSIRREGLCPLEKQLAASQAMIEKMKCCGNCENECDCNTDYREDRDSPNCCIGTGDKDMPDNWKLKGM